MLQIVKKYWKEILLLVFGVVIVLLLMSTTCTNQKLNKAENNVVALTDSIRSYKLKNGDLITTKQALILEKDELEKYLEITNKEKKDIEKKLNSALSYIAEVKTNIKLDTIRLTDSVFVENNITNIRFSYKDNWVNIDGLTKFENIYNTNTTLNNLDMNVPLTVGFTDNNQFFATSSNPYISITNIDGAKILSKNNKPKKWGFGPMASFGVGYGWGTDFKGGNCNGGLIVGFTVGVSLHYDIFQW